MLLQNVVMLVFTAGILASCRLMRGWFRPIEKLVFYFVTAIVIQQAHSAIADNLKLLQVTQTFPAFLFFKLSQIIVFPLVTVWLLYLLYRPGISFPAKLLLSVFWLAGLSALYPWYQALGVLQLTGWNYRYALLYWLTVFALSLGFSLWFRALMRKEDARRGALA